MKKVFLLGDSIRYGAYACTPQSPGYGRFVQEYLGEDYLVDAVEENCRFAQYTLRYIWEWASKTDSAHTDIVHFNNGLWDVIELEGSEGPMTDIDFYLKTLEKVVGQLRHHFPNAKLIFATSTPVIEAARPACFGRKNAVIEAYNEAAVQLMEKLGVAVDDLHTVAVEMGDEVHSDWVHYNEAGSRILAKAVADCIRKNATESAGSGWIPSAKAESNTEGCRSC